MPESDNLPVDTEFSVPYTQRAKVALIRGERGGEANVKLHPVDAPEVAQLIQDDRQTLGNFVATATLHGQGRTRI